LYKDEPFFGPPRFAIEGKIFRYDPGSEEVGGSISAGVSGKEKRAEEKALFGRVGEKELVASVSGAWNGKSFVRKKGATVCKPLFLISPKLKTNCLECRILFCYSI
jgi:hypothetical protein